MPTKQWRTWMAMLLTACWMTMSVGCATKLTVIAADKAVVPMPAGQPYTPATDGFFVPSARMQQILHDQADAIRK